MPEKQLGHGAHENGSGRPAQPGALGKRPRAARAHGWHPGGAPVLLTRLVRVEFLVDHKRVDRIVRGLLIRLPRVVTVEQWLTRRAFLRRAQQIQVISLGINFILRQLRAILRGHNVAAL
eukprot:CAMPEP_0182556778 /NCGR_PEP_ID=MMETSP1324-20130603/930_1 /TAXON_ID=236786 /ORGANISM="Florenciella sp., Strain RCC1587" /LENGTH=119 /DNA_ID=CAMNT_0024768727 /DNA_START=580 /DNA_END=939 /DNA_ORIENTATION=-